MPILKTLFHHIMAAAILALTISPAAVAGDPIDFQCITTNKTCSRTFSCPIFQRLTSAKAICNLEGLTLASSDLDATAANTLRVMRPSVPVSGGLCNIDATSVSQNAVTLPNPAFGSTARQFSYGCSDIDDPQWGNGECQIIGKAICEPYFGELRIANIKTGTDTVSNNDALPLQGIARLQRTTTTGDNEYFWLTTQSSGEKSDKSDEFLKFHLTTNSGGYLRTLLTLYRNGSAIPRIGHGQSLFVSRNSDESYTVLTEAENLFDATTPADSRQRLLYLKLDKTLTSLTYIGEITLKNAVNRPPVKAFSIRATGNQFRMAVETMETNSSSRYGIGRKIRVSALDSSWLSTLVSSGKILMPTTPSHEFWLDDRIYLDNQGILLLDNALASLAGGSAMPPENDVGDLCNNEVLPVEVKHSVYKRFDYYVLDATRAFGSTALTSSPKRRCLKTDRADAVSRGGEAAHFEPEGLFSVNDEIFFSINYGESPQRVKRIYRVSEQFFTSLP